MSVRCLYLDLDGTLLGRGASLVHDGEGNVSMEGLRALQACLRADVEIVLMSGRRRMQVAEDARLFGQSAYIFEAGACVVLGAGLLGAPRGVRDASDGGANEGGANASDGGANEGGANASDGGANEGGANASDGGANEGGANASDGGANEGGANASDGGANEGGANASDGGANEGGANASGDARGDDGRRPAPPTSGASAGGEEHWLTGALLPGELTIAQQIERSGAPALLLERYAGRLEYHEPWHLNREVSHLFRGLVDALEVDALLAEHGHDDLRLVDNGVVNRRSAALADLPHVRGYHLVPAGASKAAAVAFHRQVRGYAREQTLAVGDSREDLACAEHVGSFWLVANAVERDPSIRKVAATFDNVRVADAGHGAGVYEAVVSTLVTVTR